MKSDWTGSRLRATYYPSNPSDPNCNTYRIFVYERVSYGDSLAACLLEIMMRLFIAPDCETKAGARVIELERYVNDVLKSGVNKDDLWDAVMDMKSALEANGFSIKQVFSSFNWHKAFDKNYNEADYEPSKPETIFHHQWLWSKDTLQIIPDINLYRRKVISK